MQQDNDHYLAAYNLGLCLYRSNNYTQSLDAFILASKQKPNAFRPWYMRGLCLYKSKEFTQSIDNFTKAQTIESSHRNFYNMGLCHDALNDHQQAQKCYLSALELNPLHCLSLSRLAKIFHNSQAYPQSISMCTKLQEIKPNSKTAYHIAAKLHQQQRLEEMRPFLDIACKGNDDVRSLALKLQKVHNNQATDEIQESTEQILTY
ncbi:MAG: tetratricopeptide repeat protein [Planctomycetes bacterium]|nr:tetratricopeptide repeat protein [Planctomycetota bacterium]